MQMAQNCSCLPLLKQLYGRRRSLLLERIIPFVYGSRVPIFILLVIERFSWIPHVLSIIDEETHHLQKILKTFDCLFVFSSGCRPLIDSLIFIHIIGSDKPIQGARV